MVLKVIEIIFEQVDGISIPYMIITMLIGFILIHMVNIVLFRLKGRKISLSRMVMYCLIFVSWSFMLQITIINRVGQVRDSVRIVPFTNIISNGSLSEKALLYALFNIMLFVPYGFFWAALKEEYKANQRVFMIMIYSFLTSLVIEFIQFFTRWGYFETEDLICNTLGGAIGCIIYSMMLVVIEKLMSKKNEGEQ